MEKLYCRSALERAHGSKPSAISDTVAPCWIPTLLLPVLNANAFGGERNAHTSPHVASRTRHWAIVAAGRTCAADGVGRRALTRSCARCGPPPHGGSDATERDSARHCDSASDAPGAASPPLRWPVRKLKMAVETTTTVNRSQTALQRPCHRDRSCAMQQHAGTRQPRDSQSAAARRLQTREAPRTWEGHRSRDA